MDEAGDMGGGDGACSEGGGSSEEAPTCALVVLEGLLRGDVGGADAGVETIGFAEKHVGSSLACGLTDKTQATAVG
jgi:hypothetical protein